MERIINWGLQLAVMYRRPRYSPINHNIMSCTPARRKTADDTVAHPGGVEKNNASITTMIKPRKPNRDKTPPAMAPTLSGIIEKLKNIEEKRCNNLERE